MRDNFEIQRDTLIVMINDNNFKSNRINKNYINDLFIFIDKYNKKKSIKINKIIIINTINILKKYDILIYDDTLELSDAILYDYVNYDLNGIAMNYKMLSQCLINSDFVNHC